MKRIIQLVNNEQLCTYQDQYGRKLLKINKQTKSTFFFTFLTQYCLRMTK